jgi:hypothetical protein
MASIVCSRWPAVSVGAVGFWPLVRSYWTFVLLGIAAVVLLLVGAPTKVALAGAGFAFAGAAVTRFIDIAGARKAAAGRADEVRLTDLDERAALRTRLSSPGPLASGRYSTQRSSTRSRTTASRWTPMRRPGTSKVSTRMRAGAGLKIRLTVSPLSEGRSRRAPVERVGVHLPDGLRPPGRTSAPARSGCDGELHGSGAA